MSFFDAFSSSSFLFSISIVIIFASALFAYVSYRMSEQDHKLNSMIGLISTMAEETHFLRSKLSGLQQKIEGFNHITKEDLIDVSDDDSDDDDIEDLDAEDLDNESNEDDLEPNSENSESQDLEDINDIDIDVNDDDDADSKGNHILNVEELDIEDINNNNNIINDSHLSEVKTIHIELDADAKLTEDDMGFLKNVSIDLGENDHEPNKYDYKKMSLNKLREIAVTKGVVSDASKLKKNDILKLLDEE